MVYHSTHHFDKDFITSELKTGNDKFGDNYLVAYGTIARGIEGWEPRLTLSQLKEDLAIAQGIGIREVVIYRLGGLTKDCTVIMGKYTKNS